MVVGPLMQGFVLMGIIYWYSKGMISMINDYYRSEFQRKLQNVNDTQLDATNYDVENFDDLLNVESFIEDKETVSVTTADWRIITESLYEGQQEKCYGPRNLAFFMYLIGLNSSEVVLECRKVEENSLKEGISLSGNHLTL